MTGRELLLTAWDPDPLVLGACATATAGYAAARRRQPTTRTWFFAAAIAVCLLALVSPIGVLAHGYLFSAHMLQHLLLLLVVPPLLLASMNAGCRGDTLRPGSRQRAAVRERGWLARRPFVAWALGVGAMWLWHAPTLCDAASRSTWLERVQSASLVLMGLGFWWPVFAPRAEQRLAPLASILYLFTACVACTALGILVTFSPVELCSVFLRPVDRLGALPLLRDGWGLTPKNDQEIGGLLMWVPACLVYAITIVAMLARYYRDDEAPTEAAS